MSRVDEKLRRSGGRKADRRRRSPGRAIRPTVEALERYELLATLIYNVTTASDSFFEPPIGSLREAITLANANVGVGDDAEIRFQIPGAEVHTIAVAAVGLPTVRVPTLIDGRSQGGVGYAGAPLIVIDNANAIGDNGLELAGTASGSTLRGLSIVNAETPR